MNDLPMEQIINDPPMEQIITEIVPFTTWLVKQIPLRTALEIGVRRGGTAALWHRLFSDLVIGVDWTGKDSLGEIEVLQLAKEMEKSYPHYRFVCGDSHNIETRSLVCQILDKRDLDFLFLDGDHSYEGVTIDWTLYRPLVRPGGVIAFHDIVDSPFMRKAGHGVYRFWAELPGNKKEFCVQAEWGGIGAVIV